jgi:wyosine [tRNA(Phe)-imidazoG37] synthetase (radical SAM superfamily)
MKSIFGPVPSRRLGRSLGIDVIAPKTCTYDCIYCESGRTTNLTVERQTLVPPDQVMRDLEDFFQTSPNGADVLTFSSAGEPTLYEPLAELISLIKRRYPSLPLIVITNGSLLWDAGVRQALIPADRVVPSLDAVSSAVFRAINRPHPSIDLAAVIEGLYAFGRDYRGQLHIEVMLVSGCNEGAEELRRIHQVIDRLSTCQIELNTVVRPPAYKGVKGLSLERMKEALSYFPAERTSIIGEFKGHTVISQNTNFSDRVLEMVARRPCTVVEMAVSLGVQVDELETVVLGLKIDGRLSSYLLNEQEFLCPPGR